MKERTRTGGQRSAVWRELWSVAHYVLRQHEGRWTIAGTAGPYIIS
jgi:hypothetical protein